MKCAYIVRPAERRNPLPSAFVRLWFPCSWQYSRREILRAKSPGPASTVKVEAAGDGGTTLTGADGPYNDEAFRAKTGPHYQLVSSPAELTAIPVPIVIGLRPFALRTSKERLKQVPPKMKRKAAPFMYCKARPALLPDG